MPQVQGNRRSSCFYSLRSSTFICAILIGLLAPVCILSENVFGQQPGAGQESQPRLLINLYYDYWNSPRLEVAGKNIDNEYAEVIAMTLGRQGFKPDELKIQPLFSEIVDTMRQQNLTEGLALLSLVTQYKTASPRFINSTFSKVIKAPSSNGRSTYSLSRLITVELLRTKGVILPAVIQSINQLADRGGRRTGNYRITAFPVEENFVAEPRIEADQVASLPQLKACQGTSTSVGIIADNFIPRLDLPQLSPMTVAGPGFTSCDGSAYAPQLESFGTNLAGVIAARCPNCKLLGLDVGCAQQTKIAFTANDVMRAIMSATLRDVDVLVLPHADRNFDTLLSNIINTAIDAGVIVIAPAGDRGQTPQFYPAAYRGAFGVTALGVDGKIAEFSNRGSWAIASAPGVRVATTHRGNGFISMTGTALAAAHFASLVARHIAANPKASAATVLSALSSKDFLNPPAQECRKAAETPSSGGGTGGGNIGGSSGGNAGGAPGGLPSDTPGSGAGATPIPSVPPNACGPQSPDQDRDGIPDCSDPCQTDPAKTEPGICGCGKPDIDTDGDKNLDCIDGCPNDPAKTAPGQCGCGKTEASCGENDLCPNDTNKNKPGVCGCGVPDVDQDKDGKVDCKASRTETSSDNDSPFKSEKIITLANLTNKQIAADLASGQQSLARLLKSLGVPSSAAPNLSAENATITKGTQLVVAVDYSKMSPCTSANAPPQGAFSEFFKGKEIVANYRAYEKASLPLGTERLTLASDTTVAGLRKDLEALQCPGAIVGLQDTSAASEDKSAASSKLLVQNTSRSGGASQNKTYLEATNFEKSLEYFKANASTKVTVAFIDTGYDRKTQNPDITDFSSIMTGSNLVATFERDRSDPNNPQDTDGQGTMAASIAGSLANNSKLKSSSLESRMTLLPIRIQRTRAEPLDPSRLVEAIRLAVNSGAQILTISLNAENRFYADPIVGEALFRAIEKGVTCVFAAGDGIRDENEQMFPIRLKSPNDFGIQTFGRTVSPAAWGLYFKGAVAVGGVQTGSSSLYLHSNYGASVELAAPATAITSRGLGGAVASGTGTQFSAPMVTAAAAFVLSEFKTKGFKLTPWLLEDILLNAMPQVEALKNSVRSGRSLDFEALAGHLATLSKMTEDDRLRIPSDNQDVDTGRDPNSEIARIAEILVNAPSSLIIKGETVQLRATARNLDGTLVDITRDPDTFWTVEHQNTGHTQIDPRTGALSLDKSSTLAVGTPIRVLVHYKTDLSGKATLTVGEEKNRTETPSSVSVSALVDGKPADITNGAFVARWGSVIQPRLSAVFKSPDGKETTRDVTSETRFVSSKPDELVQNGTAGLFFTQQSFGGSSYLITGEYAGQSVQLRVSIEKVTASLRIENALGNPFKGQVLPLRAVLVLAPSNELLSFPATWQSLSPELSLSRTGTSEVSVETESLALKTYEVQARVEFRGAGDQSSLTATRSFTVKDSIGRLELLTKTPAISASSRAVFALRLYNNNNSYSVIHPSRIRWLTNDPALAIDGQGIVIPTAASVKNGQPTSYTISAMFLDQTVSAKITILPFSERTGTNAELSHIAVNAEWDQKLQCSTAVKKPGCEKIVVSGADPTITGLQANAFYTDGTVRDVTQFASWNSSHPYASIWVKNSPKYSLIIGPQARPGDLITVTALYEGQAATQSALVLPLKDISLEMPKDGITIPVTKGVNSVLPEFAFTVTDARGYTSQRARNAIERPQLWSSKDPLIAKALEPGNTPIRDSDRCVVNTAYLPTGTPLAVVGRYSYEGYGFSKEFSTTVNIVSSTSAASALRIKPLTLQSSRLFREDSLLVTCELLNTDKSSQQISCSDVSFKVNRQGTSSIPQDVTASVYRSETGGRISFAFPVADGEEAIFSLTGTHNQSGIESTPQQFAVIGTSRIDPVLAPGALPTLRAAKEDDPFCTSEVQKRDLAGGTGTKADPFVICTALQLQNISLAVGHTPGQVYLKLLANLDFSSAGNLGPIRLTPQTSAGSVQELDGNGYFIRNVTMVDRERNDLGLFVPQRFDLRNLTLENIVIRGGQRVGAIAGAFDGRFSNVQVLRATIQGTSDVGALTGQGGLVENVLVHDSQVYSEQGRAGCFFGSSSGVLKVSDSVCQNTSVNMAGVQGTQMSVGGLIGEARMEPSTIYPADKLGWNKPETPLLSSNLQQPVVHLANSHFIGGTINSGLNFQHSSTGQSNTGGLIGVADAVVIVGSSVKAMINATGSNVGGIAGEFRCRSRNAAVGLLHSNKFVGTITGGANLAGASNTGAIAGNMQGSCMVIGNTADATIRGVTAVGGLVGNAMAGGRYLDNKLDINPTSSAEPPGGFIGTETKAVSRFKRYSDDALATRESIYTNNSWRYTGTERPPQDIGVVNDTVSGKVSREVDVTGVN